jgi:hypothetical protein
MRGRQRHIDKLEIEFLEQGAIGGEVPQLFPVMANQADACASNCADSAHFNTLCPVAGQSLKGSGPYGTLPVHISRSHHSCLRSTCTGGLFIRANKLKAIVISNIVDCKINGGCLQNLVLRAKLVKDGRVR